MESPVLAGGTASMPDSLWAAVSPDTDNYEQFNGDQRCDVGIVGGGLLGLSTALALRESGVDVALLEAAYIGWGASGRNNGLVTAGLKRDPWQVRRILGEGAAEPLIEFSAQAPSRLFELIATLDIECDLSRGGWLQAAHANSAIKLIRRRFEAWHERGADVEWVEPDDVPARLGTDCYAGAWCDRRGGSLNPLTLTRGIARAAAAAGARVHVGSPVTSLARNTSGVSLQTPSGKLSCSKVILCSNAYGNFRPVRGTVVPVRTAQVASAPLPQRLLARITPGGEAVSDTRRLLTSFRKTADGRLIMGGASATSGDETNALRAALHSAAARLFGHDADIDWQYFWSGYLAITSDHLPAIYDHGDGILSACTCNGRGIAMSTTTGPVLAKVVTDELPDVPLPIRSARMHPGYFLRGPGIAATVAVSRLLDQLGH